KEDSSVVLLDQEEMIGGGVAMGFRKSDGDMRTKFDAAIQSMKDDGSLNELITKWEVASTF
ncbi:MAG: transporter substrate-binding domain-containing protein, partial [Erythrobacter sp.]